MKAEAPGRVDVTTDEATAPRIGIVAPAPARAPAQALLAEFLVLELVSADRHLQADELAHAFLGLLPRSSALLDDADTAEIDLAPSADPGKTAVVRTLSVRLVLLPDGRELVQARDHSNDTACTLIAQIR
jgi:hypothetical protein